MKYRDDICRLTNCVNLKVCQGLCGFLKDVVNNQSSAKEVLLSNLISPEKLELRDYKEAMNELAENQETRNEVTFERMRELTEGLEEIPFYQQRKIAITILLSLGFTKNIIQRICRLSTTRLWEILR